MMADMTLSSSRRAFLQSAAITGAAAVVALPGIAGATPATVGIQARWNAAMDRFQDAEIRMNAGMENAVSDFIEAEAAIFETLAPDLKAVRWKVAQLQRFGSDFNLDPKDLNPLLVDLSYIMGVQA